MCSPGRRGAKGRAGRGEKRDARGGKEREMGIKKQGGAGGHEGWEGSSKGAACLSCLGEMHKSQVPFWGVLGGTPQRAPPPRGEGAA